MSATTAPSLLYYALKSLELLPNALMATFTVTDVFHGKMRKEMGEHAGFPPWFPTVLGLFKLSQTATNWIQGGKYTTLSQLMMAYQMGGVAYTHGIAEGNEKGVGGQVPALVFLGMAVGLTVLQGDLDLTTSVVACTSSWALGFLTGFAISALGHPPTHKAGSKKA
eukprot:gb/GEZN01014539.1/.p1 GENE.gb/GEZN01014539.1/~~gb/GEZN01014539.1/.p1  ORF type:complete len:191 (+),score=28.31 gb/GEZN01014539.1/:78-575(+)